MITQRRRSRRCLSENRDIAIECLSCQKTFYAVVPLLSHICPDCQLQRPKRPERSKFSVTEAFEGRRVFIVKKFMEVGGKPYWQHYHEADDIENARTVIPEGARRYSKGILDPSDVVETWIG
jgi:hypothetical protein